MHSRFLVALVGLAFTSAVAQQRPSAGEVRVLCSNGMRAVIEQLRGELEQAVGYPLSIEFSTAAGLKTRIEAGESFDVALLTPPIIDELVRRGKVEGARTDLARAGVGVGAVSDAEKVDVSTLDALRRTLLAAKSVVYTADGQSRATIDAAFAKLGITAVMGPKTILKGPGEAPESVVAGEAELVVTLVSEILPIPGLQLLGPFPPEVQGYISFAAGVSANATNAAAATEVVRYLARPMTAAVLAAHGMEPVDP